MPPIVSATITNSYDGLPPSPTDSLGEPTFLDPAFFNLSNRMANLADMRPNAELYAMGRDLPVPDPAPSQAAR